MILKKVPYEEEGNGYVPIYVRIHGELYELIDDDWSDDDAMVDLGNSVCDCAGLGDQDQIRRGK